MIVLDAYCLVALALDEPAAEEVEELLHADEAAVASVNLLETIDLLLRREQLSEPDVRLALDLVVGDRVSVRDVDEGAAWRAAIIRARHYARRTCELSLADCALLAAVQPGERVATADPAVAAVARAEGIALVPVRDSGGRRP